MSTIEFLRQFRIGEYAIFDLVVAFLGVYLLSPLLSMIFRKIKIDIPKKNWIFLTLPLSILIHVIVGKITPMTRDFMDMQSHYVLKIVIVVLLVVGLKDIRMIKKKTSAEKI